MSKIPETLTYEESIALWTQLLKETRTRWTAWKNHRNALMMLLMLDAGLRVGEVVKLRVGCLMIDGEPVKALDLSGDIAEKRCNRVIPITGRLTKAIAHFSQIAWPVGLDPQECFAFYERDCRKNISSRQVQRIIKDASVRAIGRAIHPHVLRHTFATRLMRVTSTSVVQQLLGHKHLSSTQVYVHPNGDDRLAAIKALETSS